jgi:hypothetical protein
MVETYKRIEDILMDNTIIATDRVNALNEFEYVFNHFFPYNSYCNHLGYITKHDYDKCYTNGMIAANAMVRKYKP